MSADLFPPRVDTIYEIHHPFWRRALLGLTALVLAAALALPAAAQSLTTGAISGTITDPSGAMIPGARITAVNAATGETRTTQSGPTGTYTVAQIPPGEYSVKVERNGFQTAQQGPITVVVSQIAHVAFRMRVGETSQTVEVTEQAPLLQPDNPNTSTTVSQTQIENMPNAGNDLSYEAQIAPGAVMNSTGGYGNVEFNGLPSVSNNFTMNGLDNNNANLNLNGSGATNLQLGLNDVSEVTVNTNSFAADQGRQAGAQANYLSKSGSNNFHGNLYELWNGRAMDANDFFLNMVGAPRTFSNVNEFGGSFGGPIIKNKLFFFYDLEGIYIDLPVVNQVTVPTQAYQTYSLAQLQSTGGFDPLSTGNNYCPPSLQGSGGPACAQPLASNPAEVPFFQQAYKLYNGVNTSSFAPTTVQGCTMNADGTQQAPYNPLLSPGAGNAIPNGDGCALIGQVGASAHTHDKFQSFRADYDRSATDTFWGQFTNEHGLQATYTDPINSIFNSDSDQPERTGSAGWTHIFSPNVVNVFTPGFTWGDAVFNLNSYATAQKTLGVELVSPFYTLNNSGSGPTGYNTTIWQLNDDLSWIEGPHSWKFGVNFRRVDLTNTSGYYSIPYVGGLDLPEFTYGDSSSTFQNVYSSIVEPTAYWNMDMYAMDTWHWTPKLTLTLGIRTASNSNPVNQHDLNSNPNGDWNTFIQHNINLPLGSDFSLGQHKTFTSVPAVIWQPRAALAYQLAPRTLLKGGWGMFEDIYPGTVSSTYLGNPPYQIGVDGGLFGQTGGEAIAPGVPNSAVSANLAAASAFQSLFANGGLSCVSANANPNNCVPSVGATAFPWGENKPMVVYEWSAGVDQQITQSLALHVKYVGNHSTHVPYTYAPNGYETMCAGCFSPYPYGAAPDARFTNFTQYEYDGSGNYNALQTSVIKHVGHGLMFQGNYTWSHCLDTISNGGLFSYAFGANNTQSPLPGELGRDYGNCDYDIRNSFNGTYTYQLPFHVQNSLLAKAVNGWQLSGTVILHSGLPITMYSGGIPGGTFFYNSGDQFPNAVPGQSLYAKSPISGVTQSGQIQWLNPAAFASVWDPDTASCYSPTLGSGLDAAHCQFGDIGRNTVRAPGFTWSDLFLTKYFQLTEKVRLRVDGQFFNWLNHPNFGFPSAYTGIPGAADTLTGMGTINRTLSPPTSLLGTGLGGDSSMRMIALQGKIEF